MEYPHSYPVGVPAWVLQGSIGATSKKQHGYFSGTLTRVWGLSNVTLQAAVILFTYDLCDFFHVQVCQCILLLWSGITKHRVICIWELMRRLVNKTERFAKPGECICRRSGQVQGLGFCLGYIAIVRRGSQAEGTAFLSTHCALAQ